MPRFLTSFLIATSIAAAAAGCSSLDLAGDDPDQSTGGDSAGAGGTGAGGNQPMPIDCPTDSTQSVACYGDDVERQDAFAVAVDAMGAAVVTGSFHGTLDFGDGVTLSTSPEVEAIFVVKLSPEGVPVWARRLGGDKGNGYGTSVAFDPSGDIVVAGEYGGSGDFGGKHVKTVGVKDAFVTKLTPEGGVRWVREYGSDVVFDEGTETEHGATAFAARVAVSAAGDILVTGESDVLLDFGDPHLKTSGDGSIFTLKLSPEGIPQWSRWFHGSLGEGVAVDPAGDVVMSGLADGALVAKISADGDLLWEKTFRASLAAGDAITTDLTGDIVVTGSFLETIDIDGTTLTSAGSFDVFMAKLNPYGDLVWATSFGSADLDAPQDIAVDAGDNLLLTGHFRGTGIDFGGGPLENRGDDDLFVAKLTGSGEHLWSHGYGDTLTQIGRGVAPEPQGDALVVGLIGAIDAYQTDVLVARFGP